LVVAIPFLPQNQQHHSAGELIRQLRNRERELFHVTASILHRFESHRERFGHDVSTAASNIITPHHPTGPTMPGTASPSGANHVQFDDSRVTGSRDDNWICDAELLTNWQVQLVDCCQAINAQLSQIKDELNSGSHAEHDVAATATFRVIGG